MIPPQFENSDQILRRAISAGALDEIPAAFDSWCAVRDQHMAAAHPGTPAHRDLLVQTLKTLEWAGFMVAIRRSECAEDLTQAARLGQYLSVMNAPFSSGE